MYGMHWIQEYDLILFDFDGLLVNTEQLHFEAYRLMCRARGVDLSWDFEKYCSFAHADSKGLREQIYLENPGLQQSEPRWEVLYEEKKKAYLELLSQGGLELMPGVEWLLQLLAEQKVSRCVVTNSFREQIEAIRGQLPILQTIPYWITREDYTRLKPDPEPYQTALKRLSKPGDRVIGFEDTLRGWEALHAAGIPGIVVSSCLSPAFRSILANLGVLQLGSFEDLKTMAHL